MSNPPGNERQAQAYKGATSRRLSVNARSSAEGSSSTRRRLSRNQHKAMESTKQTEEEVEMKRLVREQGRPAQHRFDTARTSEAGEEVVLGRGRRSREKTVCVDLGNGPEEVVMIDWAEGDPENPFNYPLYRKALILSTACMITLLTALNCTSVAIIANWGIDWFGVNREQFFVSQTVMMIPIAITPMLLAPLSEALGRNVIYQVTSVITALLFLPQALTRSYAALLIARFFQGMSSSVGNSMVGGTVADLFHAKHRGLAMNVFAVLNFIGGALGSVATGWVGLRGGSQWAYGYQGILAGLSIVLNLLFLRETRGDVLLSRRAKKLTKLTGRKHCSASDLQKKSFITILRVSLVRPFVYLGTEPIVTALSVWIGFAWSCLFLSAASTLLVFGQYGWNVGQLGSIQACLGLGGILGFITNYYQEHLYAKKAKASSTGRAPPEARLYCAAFVGLAFPIGLYGFAWTGRPDVHWVVPAIFLVITNCGLYHMYVGVFNYLADAYETYSSSAQAAQSSIRNVGAAVIPLFANQMYERLGYAKATTLVASVALALQAAPLLLLRYGQTLRARSRVASALEGEREVDAAEEEMR